MATRTASSLNSGPSGPDSGFDLQEIAGVSPVLEDDGGDGVECDGRGAFVFTDPFSAMSFGSSGEASGKGGGGGGGGGEGCEDGGGGGEGGGDSDGGGPPTAGESASASASDARPQNGGGGGEGPPPPSSPAISGSRFKDYMLSAFRDILGDAQGAPAGLESLAPAPERPPARSNEDEDDEEDPEASDFSSPDPLAPEDKDDSKREGRENMPLDRNPEYLRGLIRKLNASDEPESGDSGGLVGDSSSRRSGGVPDAMFWSYGYDALCDYAVIAKGADDPKWDLIRERLIELRQRGAKVLREAAEADQGGQYHTTPLHLACRRKPPADVIAALVDASPRMLNWGDRNDLHSKWLPLHCAAEYRASADVVSLLASRYPPSRTARTFLGNTPLHLACTFHQFNDEVPSPKVVSLLADDDGVLSAENEEGLTALDKFMRSIGFMRLESGSERESCVECIKILVKGTPLGAGRHIESFNLAPWWLQDVVLGIPEMQSYLNDTMKNNLSTGVLMADFYAQIALIVTFTVSANRIVPERFDSSEVVDGVTTSLVFLFISNGYMVTRETVHMFSEGATWLSNPWNWLDAINNSLVLASSVLMATGLADDHNAKILVMVTGGMVWVKAIAFLRSTYRPFAVFASGVFHMLASIVPFLVTTTLVLGAFAHMYYINTESAGTCESDFGREGSSFCTYKGSWLQLYTFFIGGLSDFHFTNGGVQDRPGEIEEYYNPGNLALSVVYGFLIAIVLRSILIAIASNAWSRTVGTSEVVFWTARINFVSEVELIRACLDKLREALCPWRSVSKEGGADAAGAGGKGRRGADQWVIFWDIVALTYANHRDASVVWEEVDRFERSSISCLLCGYHDYRDWRKVEVSLWVRRVAFLILGLVWLAAGLVTFGWLWPEKVREFLFCPSVSSPSEEGGGGKTGWETGSGSEKEMEERMARLVKEEMRAIKQEILSEIGKMMKNDLGAADAGNGSKA